MLYIPGLNTANYSNCVTWDGLAGNITTVGFNGGPSSYDTYDQNGNVWEWLGALIPEEAYSSDGTYLGQIGYFAFAGGSYKSSQSTLSSSYIHSRATSVGANDANNDRIIYPDVGFRVFSYTNPLDLQFFVPVKDVNNAPNSTRLGDIGQVNYSYQVCQYPVLVSDYVRFLNTVDPQGIQVQLSPTTNAFNEPIVSEPFVLYHYLMTSDPRGGILYNASADIGNKYAMKPGRHGKPINFVSFYMAASYCNWLHNKVSDPDATDYMTGSFDLGSIVGGLGLDIQSSISPNARLTNSNPKYFLPTLSEWYKAAYYKGGNRGNTNAGYWLYATRSDTAPSCSYADASGIGPWKYTLDYINIPINNLNSLNNYTVTLSIKENNMYDAYLDKYSYSFISSKTTENIVVGLTKNALITNLTIVATVTNTTSNMIENILYIPMMCSNSSCLLDIGYSPVVPTPISS